MLPDVDEARQEARRYVRRKRIFYLVLGIWAALSVMWFLIDVLDDRQVDWFYWPMLGTGLAVAISGIVLLGFGGLFGPEWERRQVERYLNRHRTEDPGGTV
jgi:2TM domain